MVPQLTPIPADFPIYVLEENVRGEMQTIGATVQHTNNHNATSAAITGLLKLALKYHTAINPGAGLYINDASLPWGGLMDDSGQWTPPHSTHRKGYAIDIRAQTGQINTVKLGEVPSSMFNIGVT